MSRRPALLLVSDALVPLLRGQFEGVTVLVYGAPPDRAIFLRGFP
jgi:hypothetical protein